MAFSTQYEKKSLQNQGLFLSAFDRIEQISLDSTDRILEIQKVGKANLKIERKLFTELKLQTKILSEINTLLKQEKKEKTDNLNSQSKDISNIKDSALAIGAIAISIVAFGAALGFISMMGGIDLQSVASIAIAMVLLVPAYIFAYEQLKGISFDILPVIVGVTIMSYGIVSVGYIMQVMPKVKPDVVASAALVSTIFIIMSYSLKHINEVMATSTLEKVLGTGGKRISNVMNAFIIMGVTMSTLSIVLSLFKPIAPGAAASLAILAIAMIPIAMALKVLRRSFKYMSKVKLKDMLITTGAIVILSLALVPISYAAQMLTPVSPGVGVTLFILSLVMIPLAIMTSIVVSYLIEKRAAKIGNMTVKPSKKKKMKPKDFINAGIAILGVLAITVVVSWALSKIPRGLMEKAANNLPLGPFLKIAFSILVIGMVAGLIMKMIQGKSSSSKSITGLKSIWGGSEESSSSTKPIKPKDALTLGLVIGILAMAIVSVAYIYQALPGQFKAPDPLWVLQTGLSIFIIGGATGAIYSIFKKVNLTKTKTQKRMALVMIALAGVITAISWEFKMGSFSNQPSWKWSLETALSLTIFGIATAALYTIFKFAKMNNKKTQIRMGLVLVALSTIITATAIEFAGTSFANTPDYDWSLKAAFGLIAFGGAAAIVGLMDKGGFVKQGAIALLIAGAALVEISYAMTLFAEAGGGTDKMWTLLGQVGALILGLGLTMALVGITPVPEFIMYGSLAMIIAGAALISVGYGLQMMGDGIEKNKYMWAGSGHKGMFGGEMSNLEWAMLSIANSFSLNPFTTAAIYFNAPALILAGLSLISIGKGLESFNKLDIPLDELVGEKGKIPLVINAIADAFAAIGTKYGGSGLTGLAMSILGGDPVSKGIRMSQGMGEVLSELASGVAAWADLKYTDANGKQQMLKMKWLGKDGKISLAIMNIIESLTSAFGKIGKEYGGSGLTGLAMSILGGDDVSKGIRMTRGIGDVLSELADGISAWADLKYTGSDGKEHQLDMKWLGADGKISTAMTSVILSLTSAFAKIGKKYGGSGLTGVVMSIIGGDDISKGIRMSKGMGSIISDLATGVQGFANLQFPEYDEKGIATGNMIAIDEKMLGKGGIVYNNINDIVTSMTEIFGEIGGKAVSQGSTWFTSSAVEKGVNAVRGTAEAISGLPDLITSVSEIKDANKFKKNLNTVITALPEAIINGWNIYKKDKDGAEALLDLFLTFPSDLADALEKLAKQKDPIQDIAESFSDMAASMGDFKEYVNEFDLEKLQEVGFIFEQTKEVADNADDNLASTITSSITSGFDYIKGAITPEAKDNTSVAAQPQEVIVKNDNTELLEAIKRMQSSLDDVATILQSGIKTKPQTGFGY